MGKNIKMLKCFFRVMRNNQEEIDKILPSMYAESFYDIDIEYLKKKGICNLIFDIDGTLLRVDDIFIPNKLEEHFKLLKSKNFNICLLSNNNEKRVKPVANILHVNYLANAHKPLPIAFSKALEILSADKESSAMIGDQMMSDIKGSNEYGIYSVLVKSIDNHNNIQTGTSRFLQNIIEEHLKKLGIFDKDKYYKEMKR